MDLWIKIFFMNDFRKQRCMNRILRAGHKKEAWACQQRHQGQKDPVAHNERQSRTHPPVRCLWDAFSLTRFSKVQNKANSGQGTVMRAYSPSWGRRIIALRTLNDFPEYRREILSQLLKEKGKKKRGRISRESLQAIGKPVCKINTWTSLAKTQTLPFTDTLSRKLQLIFSR